MEIKKNLPLIVALGLPLLLILVIAIAVYLPGMGKQPTYDFVYATTNYPYGGSNYYYAVKNARLEQVTLEKVNEFPYEYGVKEPQLYYFDVETKKSKPLTLTEAQNYRLDTTPQSPDGFELKQVYRGGGFFWFDYGDSQYYQHLVGHNRQFATDIRSYDAAFLGWVNK